MSDEHFEAMEPMDLTLVLSGARCVCGEMAVNHDAYGCILGNGCAEFVLAKDAA